jgi:hypothetical protein
MHPHVIVWRPVTTCCGTLICTLTPLCCITPGCQSSAMSCRGSIRLAACQCHALVQHACQGLALNHDIHAALCALADFVCTPLAPGTETELLSSWRLVHKTQPATANAAGLLGSGCGTRDRGRLVTVPVANDGLRAVAGCEQESARVGCAAAVQPGRMTPHPSQHVAELRLATLCELGPELD